jgi:hypothetical protein
MISLLAVSLINVLDSDGIGFQRLTKLATDFSSSISYQFEVTIPEQITLPKSGERTDFKVGLKITNTSSQPKYFGRCSFMPWMKDAHGNIIQIEAANTLASKAIGRSAFEEIQPSQSKTFYSNAYFLNKNNQVEFSFVDTCDRRYFYNNLLGGEYEFSLHYINRLSDISVLPVRPHEAVKPIKNYEVWTGETYTQPRKLQLINSTN